jgi:tight adherence protein C
MDDQTLLVLVIAALIALGGYFAASLLFKNDEARLRTRLKGEGLDSREKKEKREFKSLVQQVSKAAAKPFMPSKREQVSLLRKRLGYAGIYAPSALSVMKGATFILLCLGVLTGYILGLFVMPMMFSLPTFGLAGYLAPTLWLKFKVKSNQLALELALPDALDLMVVCIEAGLTVDGAMQRIGEELVDAHPALSREFGIAHMETRVGLTRADSLRNLGTRTGSPPLTSLATMLIQADRFGTSIATALRVHSESLRITRQHKAEEMAAKVSVKMTFPLVLFIFPATFIVLAGPTMLQMMASPLFN